MESKLITVKELEEMDLTMPQKEDAFQFIVNQPPPEHLVKKHQGVDYIPIETIEYMLTRICRKYKVEILREGVMANSIKAVIRLHYWHPVRKEWEWQDGAGAAPIHTEKGAGPSDFTKIQTYSVQKALPAAISFATKDAAEKIGKVFGRDLNRKNARNYDDITETTMSKIFENGKDN